MASRVDSGASSVSGTDGICKDHARSRGNLAPDSGGLEVGGETPIGTTGETSPRQTMSRPPATSVPLHRLSDRALLARAAVDEAAFAEIVSRYRELLRRHAARYVGDADAEDVVQQALVNANLAIRREPERDIEPKP